MPIIDLTYDDLQPIIDILDDALLNRPEPIGEPHFDIDSAIFSAYDYSYALEELSNEDKELDSWDFEHLIQNMANGYKEFWERPFPEGQEVGQILFSAILEKPMRDLLRNLRKILREEGFDNSKPLICLDADKEVEAFNLWLESLDNDRNERNSSNCGLVLGAVLFGYWLGS